MIRYYNTKGRGFCFTFILDLIWVKMYMHLPNFCRPKFNEIKDL